MGKSEAELLEIGRRSSLARMLIEMRDQAAIAEQAEREERQAIAKQIVEADDPSEILRLANQLAEVATAQIKSRNSSKSDERLVKEWVDKEGLDPVQLYAETLWRQLEGHKASEARRLAIRFLRADLDIPAGGAGVDRARKEIDRLELKLKNLVDRPSGPLRAQFATVRNIVLGLDIEQADRAA